MPKVRCRGHVLMICEANVGKEAPFPGVEEGGLACGTM